MNTREKFEKMLQDRGMFPQQASEVMKIAMPIIDKAVDNYRFTWEQPADEYPETRYAIIYVSHVREIALEWLKENLPRAWFLPMFEE